MKSPFIRELKPDEIATAIVLVHGKEIRQKRTGEPYLSLQLGDRSGELEARMWDNVAEAMDTFGRDDFIKIKGILQIYNNRSQFTIHKLRRVEEQEVDFRDFFPASQQDPDAMWAELRGTVAGLANRHVRDLLDKFLDDADIAARFKVAPAAKSIHHAFRAGLLEHVLSLMKLARLTAGHYPNIDLNLLIAGCVLHDIGKIYELNYERGFSYSAEGQLLGHIAIGARMLGDKLRSMPDFPVELRTLIEHMILSHHGQLEFGSPRVPLFPEALLLHYLDDMDSKMECMRVLIEKDPLAEGLFTGYSASLERSALRKNRYFVPAAAQSPCLTDTAGGFAPAEEFDTVPRVDTGSTGGSSGLSGAPFPGRSPVPAPNPQPAPAVNTMFGAKLQQALHVQVEQGDERNHDGPRP